MTQQATKKIQVLGLFISHAEQFGINIFDILIFYVADFQTSVILFAIIIKFETRKQSLFEYASASF